MYAGNDHSLSHMCMPDMITARHIRVNIPAPSALLPSSGVAAEVPGEHAISPDQMMKESSSYIKKVEGNYGPGRAGMSTYGTGLVRESACFPRWEGMSSCGIE